MFLVSLIDTVVVRQKAIMAPFEHSLPGQWARHQKK